MITIDTHIIIWDALKPEMLSETAKKEILKANNSGGMIISDISLWEIAMLVKKGRIVIVAGYLDFIDLVMSSNKYIIQPITPKIADLSTSFSKDINADPADRLIAATSIFTNTSLLTANKNLLQSTILNTIW